MIDALVLTIILAQTSGSPVLSPETEPAWHEIRAAVTTLCAGADEDQQAAAESGELRDWTAYVHHVIRCGDERHGTQQALLYAEAVSQIEGSILYMKPDADEAAIWRRRAVTLVSQALGEAKADPSLVTVLIRLQDRLP
jgi:hypothetical protein